MDISQYLPHRPPFLFLDSVDELTDSSITARYTIKSDDSLWGLIYSGHYPSNPLTPGVLLCEMVFQAGACLVGNLFSSSDLHTPVVTRIENAKFRQMVFPDSTLTIKASIVEHLSQAYFMKGEILSSDGKKVLFLNFVVALLAKGSSNPSTL